MSHIYESFSFSSETVSEMENFAQYADEISADYIAAIEKTLLSFSDKSLALCNQIPSQYSSESFSNVLEELARNMSSYISTIDFDNISASLDAISKIIQQMPQPPASSDLIDSLDRLNKNPSLKKVENVNCKSDHVVIIETAIKEYKIPDTIAIPIGHGRVRMKTSDFIALISLISQLIFAIIGMLPSAPTEIETKQLQAEEAQVLLLESQNQMLRELFHNIDLSSSSQAEALRSLKESVEAQNTAISDLEESLDSIQQPLDNMSESENTESEN